MTWPFVTRGRYDDAIERLKHTAARYDELFDRYHMLKLQGANVPDPKPVLAKKEPDPVMQAISNVAGNNPALRVMMVQQAIQDRNHGMADDQIVLNIERGIPDDFGLLTIGD